MKTSVLTELASRSSDQAHPDHTIAKKLSIIANDLISDAGNHVKLIAVQNQGFDLHDQLAASGETPHKAVIEFGLAFNDASKAKYLYCRDSGIGMTKDVVSRYLLQIGTSFYKSAEFQQLSTSWNSPFTPTSQFGIGLRSK